MKGLVFFTTMAILACLLLTDVSESKPRADRRTYTLLCLNTSKSGVCTYDTCEDEFGIKQIFIKYSE